MTFEGLVKCTCALNQYDVIILRIDMKDSRLRGFGPFLAQMGTKVDFQMGPEVNFPKYELDNCATANPNMK